MSHNGECGTAIGPGSAMTIMAKDMAQIDFKFLCYGISKLVSAAEYIEYITN